jgi:hypothetical protein
MAAAQVRMRYPQADEREVFLRDAALDLSREEMIRVVRLEPGGALSPSAAAFRRILELLERPEIPHLVTGSVAASITMELRELHWMSNWLPMFDGPSRKASGATERRVMPMRGVINGEHWNGEGLLI